MESEYLTHLQAAHRLADFVIENTRRRIFVITRVALNGGDALEWHDPPMMVDAEPLEGGFRFNLDNGSSTTIVWCGLSPQSVDAMGRRIASFLDG